MDLKSLSTIQVLTILAIANEGVVAALKKIKLPIAFDDEVKLTWLSIICGVGIVLFGNETTLFPGDKPLTFIQCLWYGFLIAGGRAVVTKTGIGLMKWVKS